ncbi:MAG: hypothetical protein WCN95_12195, partial [bacterium]
MSETLNRSTLSVYRRLFTYARPYRWRLVIGILSGVVFSGSLFALLNQTPKVFLPFEQQAGKSEVQAGTNSTDRALMASNKQAAYVLRCAAYLNVPQFDAAGRMTWQFFLLTLSLVPLLVMVWAMANYLNLYNMRWLGARIVLDLRNELFLKLESQSLKFFGKCDIGT